MDNQEGVRPDPLTHPDGTDQRLESTPDENLTIGYNGYAEMTLKADRVSVRYIDTGGTVIFAEMWRVDAGGGLQRIHGAELEHARAAPVPPAKARLTPSHPRRPCSPRANPPRRA